MALFYVMEVNIGDYKDMTIEKLKQFHRERIKLLISTQPDLLAFETFPSLLESKAVTELLAEEFSDCNALLSFSCKDDHHISDGNLFSDCVKLANYCDQVNAIGVNCTSPQFIESLLRDASQHTKKPLIAYPNSGEYYINSSWVESPHDIFKNYNELEAVVKKLGGCRRQNNWRLL